MTGRGAGYCAGYQVPGYVNQGPGMGYGGWGRGGGGGGRGWRNGFNATGLTGWQRAGYGMQPFQAAPPVITGEQEMDALKEQAGYLEKSLEGINKRITELESKAGK